MFTTLVKRHRLIAALVLVAVLGLAGLAVAMGGGGADVVVYNGRSHYGDEEALKRYETVTGKTLQLRGGTAPELFERLNSEGDDTPADVLTTTDLANLWRAKEAGLLASVTSETLEQQVPPEFRDPAGEWWGMSLRIRTPMRSTDVSEDAVTSYEDLGKPEFEGRLCLRTSSNEYNQSLVADMLVKRGDDATRELLESWMANDPQILGSDVQVLEALAAGDCDVGLTNHYYLARILEEDPDFPVAPAWPDQDGAGAHTNLSGIALVKGAEHREDAIALMEHMTGEAAQADIVQNGELAVNPAVPPADHIADWADVKRDPIDVEEAGRRLPDAVALMQDVGWS